MSIVSAFCKKGGVGKSTIIGFIAHHYATLGKKVLIISADDQNSIFKIFNIQDDGNDNYLDFYMAGKAELGDILIDARENLYLIKSLNTDDMSKILTYERSKEKTLRRMLEEYNTFFDYIFIDFPPSSNRLTEVLLDFSDVVMCVVGLDALGLDGFFNTIQYFVDKDIDLNSIKYVFPNGYSPIRRAPKKALQTLRIQARDFTPKAKVIDPIYEKSIIKNLQEMGASPFDDKDLGSKYDNKERDKLKASLLEMLKQIEL